MADDTMTTFHDYALKMKQEDVAALLQMAVVLGLLHLDDETGELYPSQDSDWHHIGPIYRPTGVVLQDEEGNDYDEMAPIVDEQGVPYYHINVRLRGDSLRTRAEAKAQEAPEIAEALQEVQRYFVVDENGEVKQPDNPYCVWG